MTEESDTSQQDAQADDPFADAEPERMLTTEPHWANLADMGKITYEDAIEQIKKSDHYTKEEAMEIWFN